MILSTKVNRKKGFTIVELVIVIAVIAILAAVLIPTFSYIIEKSRHSTDVSTVTNANKLLAFDYVAEKSTPEYSEITNTLQKGGYSVPLTPKAKGYTFYWIPDKNRVVLFNEEKNTVENPEALKDITKSDNWINLSEKANPPAEPSVKPEDEEPKEPENEECILLSGKEFNSAIKSLCGNVTDIVFGKKENYKGKVTENYKKVSSSGMINAYLNGTEIYVLCDGFDIKAPQNLSNAFFEMTKLKSVEFNSFDTEAVTDMSYMFYNCNELIQLDLSSFNTENVTKTESMFEGCSNITNIYVTTGDKKWNMKKVTDNQSKEMFSKCINLPNYKHDSDDWRSFFDIFLDFIISRDVTYAKVGNGGYLTEK